MTNYIMADIRRILRKQSFLGSIDAFLGLFAVMVFIYFNPSFTAEMYVSKITTFLGYFPLVVGLFVFMSVYADDFKCKSMQVAIGYGIPRRTVILAKLLESMLLLLGIAAVMEIAVLATPMAIRLEPNQVQLKSLAVTVLAEMLRTLGYVAISTTPVFFTQNAVNGIIFYVLLASRTVFIILNIILGQEILVNTIGDLTTQLYTVQLYRAKAAFVQDDAFIATLLLALVVYVILPTVISAIGFNKKELEFT